MLPDDDSIERLLRKPRQDLIEAGRAALGGPYHPRFFAFYGAAFDPVPHVSDFIRPALEEALTNNPARDPEARPVARQLATAFHEIVG